MCAYDRALARVSRRDILKIVAAAGAAVISPPVASRTVAAQSSFSGYPFTLGVASGDPLPDGVVLWTRLAPKPLEGGGMPTASVDVGWELSDDSTFRRVIQRGTVTARPELGHSVHAEVAGLQPGREYFYRFHAGRETSAVGRTKTAPALGSNVDRLRFAVCGCSFYEVGYFTVLRHMAREQFDFIFHTGDYIYEYGADDEADEEKVRHHTGDEVYTLVDYRNRYAQYKLDPDLRAAHESAPFIVTPDDHEVDDNYADDHDKDGTPPALFLLRRAAAYQAYYESMPLRASSLPDGPHMRIYRRLHFGSLIDLSVLDTRQFRSDQACGDGNHTVCAEAHDPSRTMLGHAQERWLFDNFANARARWTVIGQQVPTYTTDRKSVAPKGRFSMDKWDGYTDARRRLYGRLIETKVPNPVILSGDVHLHFGADLKMDYEDPRSPTLGVELTNTSITSNGDGSDTQNGWDRIKLDNPHIKFHSARRGYIACTATSRSLHADFNVVDRVSVPDQPIRKAGGLIVEAGRPGALTD